MRKIETDTQTERRTNNKEGTLEREKMLQNNSVFPCLVIGNNITAMYYNLSHFLIVMTLDICVSF